MMKGFRRRWNSHPKGQKLLSEWRLMNVREPWWAEAFAAMGILMWCAWTAINGEELSAREFFRAATNLAPDHVWWMTGFCIGVVQLVLLVINDRTGRRVTCGFASWWWLSMFTLALSSDTYSPGLPLYLLLFLMNFFSCWRLKAERFPEP